jgi:Fe-Mn family superoxide dismutase
MSSISRRHLFTAAAGIIATAAAPRVFAQTPAAPPTAAPAGPFTVPPLNFAFDALEPHIDAKTMEIHHDRHHAAYVANLNTIAKTNPQLGTSAVQDILGNLNALNDDIKFAVRNNLGGHANHTMFWEIMGPNGGKPEGELQTAIDRDLGGMDKFQTDFNAAGGRQFGSGWVFVTIAKEGKLAIETRPNQDTPIMDGKRVLLGNDVWEHAYYLLYQNRRADYLKAWWNTVNWSKVGERYAAAKAGSLAI